MRSASAVGVRDILGLRKRTTSMAIIGMLILVLTMTTVLVLMLTSILLRMRTLISTREKK